MHTLPRHQETLESSALRVGFYDAITKTYPLDAHLNEHGEMATEALALLWLSYDEQGPGTITVRPWIRERIVEIEDEEEEKKQLPGYFFFTKEMTSNVSIPSIEALAWLYLQEKMQPEEMIRLIPSSYTDTNKWVLVMASFYVAYGHTNVKHPNLNSPAKFPYKQLLESIDTGSADFFKRIKRTPMKTLFQTINEYPSIQIPKPINVTVTGTPTAVMDLNISSEPNTFSTAFMAGEYFPNLREELQRGIRS